MSLWNLATSIAGTFSWQIQKKKRSDRILEHLMILFWNIKFWKHWLHTNLWRISSHVAQCLFCDTDCGLLAFGRFIYNWAGSEQKKVDTSEKTFYLTTSLLSIEHRRKTKREEQCAMLNSWPITWTNFRLKLMFSKPVHFVRVRSELECILNIAIILA